MNGAGEGASGSAAAVAAAAAAARRRMRDFSPGFEPLFVTEEGEEPSMQLLALELLGEAEAQTDKNSEVEAGWPISPKITESGRKIASEPSSAVKGEKIEDQEPEIKSEDESEESQSESQSQSSTSSPSSSVSGSGDRDGEEGRATDKASEYSFSGTETASTVVVVDLQLDQPAKKKIKSKQDEDGHDQAEEEARPHKLQKMSSFDFKKKCTYGKRKSSFSSFLHA